jgi:uncharacterized protein (DUF983 family)
MTNASHPGIDPLHAALKGRCPRCGKGRLFRNPIAIGPSCSVCDLDFTHYDRQGDGPAVFSIILTGFLAVGAAFIVEILYAPPVWLHLVLWIPLACFLSVMSIRLFKAWLVGQQYRHDADEGTLSGD